MRHLSLLRLSYTLTCFSLAFASPATAQGLSKQAVNKLAQAIEFEYQTHMKHCDTLNWNDADVCEVQARNKKLVDLAELRADAHPTAKARYAALIARVDANYEIAITECNDVPIEARPDCWRSAETAHDQGVEKAQKSFWGIMSP